ncbi:MAG: 16S rRNA methyltransferase [Treponema sp.]|nr:16S rRNA methyltransferase [Treponema sp.]
MKTALPKEPVQNPEFEAYYRGLWGDRWAGLRAAMLADTEKTPFSGGLAIPYMMDYASVLAAKSLRIPSFRDEKYNSEKVILDACAAPGGKSLVIAGRMEPGITLLSNELSAERRRRLSTVLDKHLDGDKRRQVTVSGFDAAAQGSRLSEHGRFCAILLDAPCSSEAHVLKDDRALSEWRPARPRFLARRQWALLSSAFLLLASGGSLVYSTCAISDIENDGVVKRLFEKYGDNVILDEPDFTDGEKTEFGRIILPDICGMGPMYVARVRKEGRILNRE